jgi:hypothetical protein
MLRKSSEISSTMEGAMTVSGQIELPRTRYLGIINGVVYRIESNIDGSDRMFELVPLQDKPAGIVDPVAPVSNRPPLPATLQSGISILAPSEVTGTAGGLANAQATVSEALVQKEETAVRLFPRDGAEPLRAGHPDLWALLVTGTCLDGSTFRSALRDADTTPTDRPGQPFGRGRNA